MARLLAICGCLLVFVTGCVRSAPQQPAHSRVSLVIEQSSVVPGAKVNIGIQFQIDPGWHIYWLNPGDSGEPPRIQWQLPAGVRAGELEWPTPMRLATTAGTDFGYQGTTVLLSSLQFPTTLQSGTITVGGDLRWLVCHEFCVPQSTHVEVPIQIATARGINDAAHQLLESSAERLPKPLPANFGPAATNLPDSFLLRFRSTEPITQAEFFPADEAVIDNGAPQELASQGGTVSLVLRKSEYLRQPPSRLTGVLVLNGREGYQVDVPIRSSSVRKRSGQK